MKRNHWIGIGILAIGALCVWMGVSDGQHMDVFRKAIFICLECIGIG